MEAFKERQYLVFRFEDGKDVRYDLSTGQTIGKSGRPVKDICTQLRGYSIPSVIESFPDENYRAFLKFVDSNVNRSTRNYGYRGYHPRVNKVTNVGSFLARIKSYSDYEQFFACGIKEVDPLFNYKISEVPKGLLKLCRENNLVLSRELFGAYKKYPNVFNTVAELNFHTLTTPLVISCLVYSHRAWHESDKRVYTLLNDYNYKVQSLFTYIDNLMTYEALDGSLSHIINEFYDYVRMVSLISPKYEKYPKNFLITHKIACRNYNRLKEQFDELEFKRRADKSLEYTYGDYKFIYPDSTQDIKDEAVQQNNCVASYIKYVLDGQCHILFMRKKDDTSHSLVTIEVRGNKIVQARGKFNRDITAEEREAVDAWNKKFEKKEKQAA